MTFKDFNRLVLRKELATSKLQQMINQHSYKDGRHWVWFLQDLKLMGYDYSLNFTDTLKFLWGEETIKVRSMAYNLFAICTFEEDILMKLAVIESIEATGNVALFEIAHSWACSCDRQRRSSCPLEGSEIPKCRHEFQIVEGGSYIRYTIPQQDWDRTLGYGDCHSSLLS